MDVSSIDSPVQGEPPAEYSYVQETSLPLRVLYQLLIDLYDNAYPIPFIEFRRVFDRYMKATKDNLIDVIILLIYGAGEIKRIGTGTEEISIERLIEGRDKYGEDVKTVCSPFYRFIDMDDEVRIGYDYATVIDFIDHEYESTEQPTTDITELIESDDVVKTRKLPRFPMYINAVSGDIMFDFNESTHVIINIHDMKFIVKTRAEQYKLIDSTEIDLQPVPKGCIGIHSVVLSDPRVIVTELDNGTQFCLNAEHNRFEIIEPTGNAQYEYILLSE